MSATTPIPGRARHSNFELLRIVAMAMIVAHHFVVHVLWPAQIASGGSLAAVAGINALFLGGVNLFVMISGFFGIRLTWRSLLNLWLFVGFYLLVTRAGFHYYALHHALPGITWRSALLPFAMFSRSGYWFINYYFVLMLFSPLLNYALRDMPLQRFRQCILLLTLFTCYSGFLLGNTNPTGYNAVHFLYLYVLGRYVSREPLLRKLDRRFYLGLFAAASLGYAALSYLLVARGIAGPEYPQQLFAYNNPLLLFACASLFCYFRRLNLQRHFINQAAVSMLAVYLLQESDLGQRLYERMTELFAEEGCTAGNLLLLCGIFVGLFALALLLDQVRKALCIPLARNLASRIPAKFQLDFDESH